MRYIKDLHVFEEELSLIQLKKFDEFINERISDEELLSRFRAGDHDLTDDDMDRLEKLIKDIHNKPSDFIENLMKKIKHNKFNDGDPNIESVMKGDGNILTDSMIKILKNIPAREIEESKKKFTSILKKRIKDGAMLYHSTLIKNEEKISENGLKGEWNYFEFEDYSSFSSTRRVIQVVVDPSDVIDRIFPDPERHWSGDSWMGMSIPIIIGLKDAGIPFDVIYWMYFNNLVEPGGPWIDWKDFPLHWMAVAGEIKPDDIKEIIPGRMINHEFVPDAPPKYPPVKH